ncbi:MAG: hypothetical protein ABEJ98_05135, partial [Candidatus Nanohaloarchaea archaeon]
HDGPASEVDIPSMWLKLQNDSGEKDLCPRCHKDFKQFINQDHCSQDREQPDSEDSVEDEEADEGEQEFVCEDCGKEFDGNQPLAVHRSKSKKCGEDAAETEGGRDKDRDEELPASLDDLDNHKLYACASCQEEAYTSLRSAKKHRRETGHDEWVPLGFLPSQWKSEKTIQRVVEKKVEA